MEQFYYILETFQILWPNQQNIKNFALYEEKSNCVVATYLKGPSKENRTEGKMSKQAQEIL